MDVLGTHFSCLLYLALSLVVPESPRWLVSGNYAKATSVFSRIVNRVSRKNDPRDQESISNVVEAVPLSTLFKGRALKITVIGVTIAVLQQWCGINVVFNYAQEIFSAAGYSVSDMLFNIVITGTVNVIFTFVGMYTVDRLGRRSLMLLGTIGLSLIYAVLGGGFYFQLEGIPMLVLVVLAIACYAMTLAPVTWIVISEIFPLD